MKNETIRSAALKRENGNIIEDRDHGRCYQYLKSIKANKDEDCIQGFMTSTGRFVERIEAGIIAWDAKQIKLNPNCGIITSEEIWSYGPCYYDEELKCYKFREGS